ncbi:Zinc finger protein [Oopsacas minuta]|uniref:Zinc finger protein n=1 Tax=Oopsacas minuta TaxID=111878 RepID=A0AAV7KAF5_9METZ|nr:Zinc finger protein [Oopsacas minuta]
MSNDTIKSRIVDMSNNIKHQIITKIQASPMFAIQLDESTDVANLSQLMVFARYMNGPTIEEEFLFCKPLETTTKAEDVMALASTFFGDMNLTWKNIVEVCSDGAPAMLGSRSGFISLVKHKNPNVLGTHCFIHRQALASKQCIVLYVLI